MELTQSLWPSRVWRHSPLLASQILTVLSADADASRAESCEKATELTQPLWPSSVCRHAPQPTSQTVTILMHDASSTPTRPRIKLRAVLHRRAASYACRQPLSLALLCYIMNLRA